MHNGAADLGGGISTVLPETTAAAPGDPSGTRYPPGTVVVGRQPVYQVNLWEGFGGSEVYTRSLTIALQRLGYAPTIFVDRRARHWRDMDLGAATVCPVSSADEVAARLPGRDTIVLTNTPLAGVAGARIWEYHKLITFAHQPVYQKDLTPFLRSHRVVCVSRHVLESARLAGLNVHDEPLFGVADVERLRTAGWATVAPRSEFDWDRRKVRDRLLAWADRLALLPRRKEPWTRRQGIGLGIVSRITTIKQFPALMAELGPALSALPFVSLEVFGSGGYASVRDLKRALAPLGDRVRYWGQQLDVRPAYRAIDFLLTGYPEREGLGRNAIEAQICGTPVLAIAAPPFTETVLDRRTGFLYTDPRIDGGNDFQCILQGLHDGRIARPDPLAEMDHLDRFRFDAFQAAVARLMASLGAARSPVSGSTHASLSSGIATPTLDLAAGALG